MIKKLLDMILILVSLPLIEKSRDRNHELKNIINDIWLIKSWDIKIIIIYWQDVHDLIGQFMK